MLFKSRKISIWLMLLVIVFVVYLLYSSLSDTPTIKVSKTEKIVKSTDEFGGKVGTIGDVGIETVQKARYITRSSDGKVSREFGFEKLLHAVGDEWEIEKPYMNIFRSDFTCEITADKGKVHIENALGKPSPKDATFTGNVVAHIIPEKDSGIKESFIYLDDIIFISQSSLFYTAGPVKFINQDILLRGRDLRVVYNDQADRLEFMRITHLESLQLRQPVKRALFTSQQTGAAELSESPKTQIADSSIASDASQIAKRQPAEPGKETVQRKNKEGYKCLFSKNVIIDHPEHLIFADELYINNISTSKSSGAGSPDKANEVDTDNTKVAANTNKDRPESEQTQLVVANSDNSKNVATQEFINISVTCDNGILITPADSPTADEEYAKVKSEAEGIAQKDFDVDPSDKRNWLSTQRLDYYLNSENAIASGLTDITFFIDDVMGEDEDARKTSVPVRVTSEKKAKFLPASNKVIFEGDCLCKMVRTESGIQNEYTLSAQRIIIDLLSDKDSRSSASSLNMKHFTADGGVVQLAAAKRSGEELLGFIKLRCRKFDYDPIQQLLLATTGLIAVDNSKIPEPKKRTDKFSLQRPCYAVIKGFDTLKYFMEADKIIADAKSQQIDIDYIPIIKGKDGQPMNATAGHIEANFVETAQGQNKLSSLHATGGVTYRDEDKQFVGSEMFYDADKFTITAKGNESQPFFYNGSQAEKIKFNTKKNKVKVYKPKGGFFW